MHFISLFVGIGVDKKERDAAAAMAANQWMHDIELAEIQQEVTERQAVIQEEAQAAQMRQTVLIVAGVLAAVSLWLILR